MAQQTANAAPLTVVLVHSAYADASSWNGVVERLQAAGLQVMAPANPLRGISIDSAYTASFLKQIPRPVPGMGQGCITVIPEGWHGCAVERARTPDAPA
jgi:hypothetical protein